MALIAWLGEINQKYMNIYYMRTSPRRNGKGAADCRIVMFFSFFSFIVIIEGLYYGHITSRKCLEGQEILVFSGDREFFSSKLLLKNYLVSIRDSHISNELQSALKKTILENPPITLWNSGYIMLITESKKLNQ